MSCRKDPFKRAWAIHCWKRLDAVLVMRDRYRQILVKSILEARLVATHAHAEKLVHDPQKLVFLLKQSDDRTRKIFVEVLLYSFKDYPRIKDLLMIERSNGRYGGFEGAARLLGRATYSLLLDFESLGADHHARALWYARHGPRPEVTNRLRRITPRTRAALGGAQAASDAVHIPDGWHASAPQKIDPMSAIANLSQFQKDVLQDFVHAVSIYSFRRGSYATQHYELEEATRDLVRTWHRAKFAGLRDIAVEILARNNIDIIDVNKP